MTWHLKGLIYKLVIMGGTTKMAIQGDNQFHQHTKIVRILCVNRSDDLKT